MKKNNHQFRRMLLVSIFLHVTLVAVVILVYLSRPQIELSPSSENVQLVELFNSSELPEALPSVPDPQSVQDSATQAKMAFPSLSTLPQQPTPTSTPTLKVMPTSTPTPTPSPTPKLIPTPTPTPRPTPRPRRTPRLRPTSRPSPRPTATPSPLEEPALAYDVPRRNAVIQRTPVPRGLPSPLQGRQSQPLARNTPVSGRSTIGSQPFPAGPSVMLDQADEFPYPEYLGHIQEKIAGLWFPQGSGTVSVFLIIERNGKILKSGVDKGEGVGVNKLRDSVIRTIALIKRFHPLPQEYNGLVLRVRITVRR